MCMAFERDGNIKYSGTMSNLLPNFSECLNYAICFLNPSIFFLLASILTRKNTSGNYFMW